MNEFVQFLNEVFVDFGRINSRKMFGGFGIYHDGVMIGLVADDTLYLKADNISQEHYSTKGLTALEYDTAGKKVRMSYFLAPDEIYDDPEAATFWANLAYEAALRSKSKK